jgi:RimJ/RimL family protein N-acetyltransferase
MFDPSRLIFRPLNPSDISAILEISKDIWEGEDYIPNVIHDWINAPNSQLYGFFLPPTQSQLLGFLRLNWLDKDLLWLEAGRVNSRYQKNGIGSLLIEYATKIALEKKARLIQYDTSSVNHGSIALAMKYGFHEITRVRAFLWDSQSDVDALNFSSNPIKPRDLTIHDAFQKLHEIPNAPEKNINLGWSYIPFTLEQMEAHTKHWVSYKNAVVNVFIDLVEGSFREKPTEKAIWFNLYGESQDATMLILQQIRFYLDQGYQMFEIFCHENIYMDMEKIGLKYYHNQPCSVILYEKCL